MNVINKLQLSIAPPPPPLPVVLKPNLQPCISDTSFMSEEEELDSALKKLSHLNRNLKTVFYSNYVYTKPQLQVGPNCGLVALSIASSVTQNFVHVHSILSEALSRGFTKQGEMFDAYNLAFLAEQCVGFKTKVIEGGLHKNFEKIIQSLTKKDLLLIPYDADHNHAPCCKRGYKAHWAVISGFVVMTSLLESLTDRTNNVISNCNDTVLIESQENLLECANRDENSQVRHLLTHLNFPEKLVIHKTFGDINKNVQFRRGEIYLLGRQGKSKHLGIWSFDDMSNSNSNLLYFSTNRDSECYILPEGGPAEGLKGKVIILSLNINQSKIS